MGFNSNTYRKGLGYILNSGLAFVTSLLRGALLMFLGYLSERRKMKKQDSGDISAV
jgi:hypothetical protein